MPGGQANVRRRVTAPAFRLAGSGWYETDFKKDGDKKRNLAGGDDKSSSGGSDSKPAETNRQTANRRAGKAGRENHVVG